MLYDNIPPRPAEYGNGVTTEYLGFVITDRFTILHNGKVIWDDNLSLAQCKNIINQSLGSKDLGKSWQRFISGECELENGSERRERETEQIENYYLNELNP